MSMASAFYDSQILFAASDLGIFRTVANHPDSDCDAIAASCNLDPRATRLLLDACVALDLLSKDGDRYANTSETAAFLVPGAPADLSTAIRYNRDVYAAWGQLATFARTGAPVEKPEIHLGDDEARTQTFVLSMHGRAMGIGRAVVPLLDMKGVTRLLDIGGGPGAYSTLIAKANPGLHATVLDLPGVVRVAAELIEDAGMSQQVDCLPGDYHATPFPAGNDAVIIFGVLHQESPDSIRDIFKRAAAALNPDGRIYILDMMTDETRCEPSFSALFAVNMALTTQNGWVFSSEDLKEWLDEAGFADYRCAPLPPPMPHWLASARLA